VKRNRKPGFEFAGFDPSSAVLEMNNAVFQALNSGC
jgi:hypothetical protein